MFLVQALVQAPTAVTMEAAALEVTTPAAPNPPNLRLLLQTQTQMTREETRAVTRTAPTRMTLTQSNKIRVRMRLNRKRIITTITRLVNKIQTGIRTL